MDNVKAFELGLTLQFLFDLCSIEVNSEALKESLQKFHDQIWDVNENIANEVSEWIKFIEKYYSSPETFNYDDRKALLEDIRNWIAKVREML